MSINQIVTGTVKNLLNQDEELYLERISICRQCKLITKDMIFGEICNPRLYLNPLTNETSVIKKRGFEHGCGCILKSKCRVRETHCPLNKW